MKNIFYTPQNFLAKLPDGKVVSIDDYIKNNMSEELSCPCCNNKLTLRAKDSTFMQPHFKHENGGSCADYVKNKNSSRHDVFYKREMALNKEEVENYKERIESLEYIYSFVQRIKGESLSSENQEEFLTALSCLNYEDQMWVFNYAKNSSCLKPLKKEMASTINNGLLEKLQNQYGPLGINISSVNVHCIKFTHHTKEFLIEKQYSFYGYQPPLLWISEKDLKDFRNQVQRALKQESYFKYIYDHKDMFDGEIKCVSYSDEDRIVNTTYNLYAAINYDKPIESQIDDIIKRFASEIEDEKKYKDIIDKINLLVDKINSTNSFTVNKVDGYSYCYYYSQSS